MEIRFWKDEKEKTIDPELFSAKAEDLAKLLAKDCENSRRMENKRTQIRKFYDEVVRLQIETKDDKENLRWKNYILPQLHMLIAKAAYAKGRKLVSDSFVSFIRYSVAQIKEKDDLAVFSNFFEAFMGFYRLHGPSN